MRFVACSPVADLPTRNGRFRIVAFKTSNGLEHAALIKGDVEMRGRVPVRVHSSCLTGDVFGSQRCDCREQLEAAMRMIAKKRRGVIVYLNQEGRGIGLVNKIRAYKLQENGYDTAEANKKLGFMYDQRDFSVAARILKALGVKSVLLMTNNPHKIKELAREGIEVAGRIPLIARANRHNRKYMRTKKEKLGHLIG